VPAVKTSPMHVLSRRSLLTGALGTLGALALPGRAVAGPADPAGLADALTSRATRPTPVALGRVRLDAAFRAVMADFDVTEHVHDGAVEVVLWPGDRDRLAAAGVPVRVVEPDLGARYVADRLTEAVRARELPTERQAYRVLADYLADMDRLATAHPELVKPFTLDAPLSHEGRPIHGIVIGAHVAAADGDGRPQAMMCGLHHAREWPSGELTIMFAEALVEGWAAGDPEITALLSQLCVFVLPVCNPDGFVRSRETVPYVEEAALAESLTLYAQEGPYHRKNLLKTTALPGPYEPQQGVDINRNYPYMWGGVGASASATSQTYFGPGPGSEPEIQALTAFLRGTQILTAISNHTSGDLVLRPWGYTAEEPPDEEALATLGDDMAAPMGYTSGSWNEALYPGTGIIDDWMYGTLGTYCYTLEHGSSFHPVYGDNVPGYWADNRQAYLKLLHAAVDEGQHAVLHGVAPAGTVLTLTKACTIPLSRVVDGSRELAEALEARMVVGPEGTFAWHVNPSPTAATLLAGDEPEAYVLTAAEPGGATRTWTGVAHRGERIEVLAG
jgi:hypothetical protein